MSTLTTTFKRILNFLDTSKTGNVTFKGKVEVNGMEIPFNGRVNILNGGITSINLQETIFHSNNKEK